MRIVILGLCLFAAVVTGLVVLLRRKKNPEYLLFNRSRSKKRLVEQTRRQFRAKDWTVRGKNTLVNLEVDLSVKCPIAAFQIVCLDPKLNCFLSDTSILERFEALARELRLRNEYLVLVTDDDQSAGFLSAARARGLVLVQLSEIEAVTHIIDYVDHLPKAIDELPLLVMGSSPSACADLMYRFSKAGNRAKAIEWGSRALKSHFGYFVHYALFSLLIENDDFDLAKQVGEEALSFKPKESGAFFQGFQKIATVSGDDLGAVVWAERWVKAEPDNALAYSNLADLYQKQGNEPLASVAINQALELAPTDPGILRRAVMLALHRGDLAPAFSYAERWVSQAAGDSGAYEMLADVLLKQARYDEAAVAIANAMAIHSNKPTLLRKASLVALQRGDLSGATQFAEEWRSIAPSDAWAHDHLSTLYLRDARYEQALAENLEALELAPTNPNFLRRAEQIRAKAG